MKSARQIGNLAECARSRASSGVERRSSHSAAKPQPTTNLHRLLNAEVAEVPAEGRNGGHFSVLPPRPLRCPLHCNRRNRSQAAMKFFGVRPSRPQQATQGRTLGIAPTPPGSRRCCARGRAHSDPLHCNRRNCSQAAMKFFGVEYIGRAETKRKWNVF